MRNDYLRAYSRANRMFQEGGPMPQEGGMPPGGEMMPPEGAPMPPEGGGGEGNQQEQIMALAQAAVQGDQQAAMELGMIIAQELLAGAGGGGGEGAPGAGGPPPAPEGAPVFRRGGRLS
ncbi:MAG: hypothetical protein KAH32_04800 [Chlamydiia bacterium]|nr:hypothetical protein [Chlamydiia bacterium]